MGRGRFAWAKGHRNLYCRSAQIFRTPRNFCEFHRRYEAPRWSENEWGEEDFEDEARQILMESWSGHRGKRHRRGHQWNDIEIEAGEIIPRLHV